MSQACFYSPAACLRVSGEDGPAFLQGQFTNDLRNGPDLASYGLWLNQKGRVMADSFVLRIAEKEFLVVSYWGEAGVIRKRLEDYIIADDVTVVDETAAWRAATLWGGDAEKISGVAPAAGNFARSKNALVWHGRHAGAQGLEVLFPAGEEAAWRSRLAASGAQAADETACAYARIKAGVPAVPADIGPNDLPNEGGLEDAAISYTKGCYLGQEVMARLKNLGQVRRRLMVVEGAGDPPAPHTPLHQGGRKTGEIRSSARAEGGGFVALAMLTLMNLDKNSGLSLSAEGTPSVRLKFHE